MSAMSARSSLLSPESLASAQEEVHPDDHQLEWTKRASLAQIAIPSFSAFRDRASSIPVSSPIRRKPLPENASPRAISLPFSHGASASLSLSTSASAPVYDAIAETHARPFSLVAASSPPCTQPQRPTGQRQSQGSVRPLRPSGPLRQANSPTSVHYPLEHTTPYAHDRRSLSVDSRLSGTEIDDSGSHQGPTAAESRGSPVPLRYGDKNVARHQHVANSSVSTVASTSNPASPPVSPKSRRRRSSIMSSSGSPVDPPSMTVQLEGTDRLPRSFTEQSFESSGSKSPGGKLTNFFGWRPSSQQPGQGQSPTTTFSDHSASPMPSPSLQRVDTFDARRPSMGLTPPALDTSYANQQQAQYFDVPGTPLLSGSHSVNLHVEELERELRQVSSELAGSIRREMELEDELEQCRTDMTSFAQEHPHELSRRGSDYFSDSGTSSLRFPLSDTEAKIDELEKSKRKAEQEKAQMQVDYAQRLSQELSTRKELEARVHALEEELHKHQEAPPEEPVADERVRELEVYLDDARRRLSQERQAKDNFEDLFAALREESTKHRNERDNLRDEIIPQLRARIEGLEAEATKMQSAQYEHSRMQQDIQTLKNENKLLQEAQNSSSAFNTIAEDDTVPAKAWPRAGLSRSNSLARASTHGSVKRGSSLTRSGSVKERGGDTRNRADSASNERMKDVEEQRDALHKALKNLLRRFENQKREHSKAMRRLIADRDRARSTTPARLGYSREVHFLREEIGVLRRRADEALEHKWQAENNISGVKMALDRAGQETKSLRDYLAGRQSGLIRSPPRIRSMASGLGISLAGEEESELPAPEIGEDERHAMIKVLRQSIQLAEHERDAALREAEAYRERARSLQDTEDTDVDREQELANQLLAAAGRMEELAAQVQQHLQSNMELRQRLTDAVTKGERQQHESTVRITDMQSRLKEMEENVMQAQQMSEAALGGHEEQAKRLDEANSPKLSRLNTGFPNSQRHSPLMKSPLVSQGLFIKSPRIGHGEEAQGETLFEASKTAMLERKVKALEAALADADAEMREVVERINSSQYEIAALQGERDDSQKLMRRLKKDIEDEREKTQQLMTVE